MVEVKRPIQDGSHFIPQTHLVFHNLHVLWMCIWMSHFFITATLKHEERTRGRHNERQHSNQPAQDDKREVQWGEDDKRMRQRCDERRGNNQTAQ